MLPSFDICSAANVAEVAVKRDLEGTANAPGGVYDVSAIRNSRWREIALEAKPPSSPPPTQAPSVKPPSPPPPNHAPTVVNKAAASPSPLTGTTSSLSVLGADDGGEANLIYTWETMGPVAAPVTFSVNGTNAAKSTTATFSASGRYIFGVKITDAQGLMVQRTIAISVTLPPPAPGGAGWTLVWSDEFKGTEVDTTRWKYWLDGETRRAAVNRAANTFVRDGVLTVRISNAGGKLTAGGLESKRGFGAGYFEIRGKVKGGWSTFWLQSLMNGNGGSPAADGTEMDIMEACCPGPAQHAVHWGGYAANHPTEAHAIADVTQSDWNTYGLEWTPNEYRFWVNGKLSWTFTTAVSHRVDEVLRLTQETNGDFCGGECEFLVDYVRVYRPTR